MESYDVCAESETEKIKCDIDYITLIAQPNALQMRQL